MIRRMILRWTLAADERYLHLLEREGWTHIDLRALRRNCEALRIELATCQPSDSADRIVMTASALAFTALISLEFFK